MKVQFNYSRTIDGTNYAPGIHAVPGAYADHWFFKCLLASKEVQVIDEEIHSEEPLTRDISSVPDELPKPEKKKGKK